MKSELTANKTKDIQEQAAWFVVNAVKSVKICINSNLRNSVYLTCIVSVGIQQSINLPN